jgi:gliding motility-associated-like protein
MIYVQVAAHDHVHGPSPVRFIENLGQWNGPFKYQAHVAGATVFLEEKALTWVKLQEDAAEVMHDMSELPIEQREALMLSGHAWKMHFVGASDDISIEATGAESTNYNYFLGNDASKWRSGVKAMREVAYRNIWPGIHMVMRSTEAGNFKYDIILDPNADPANIAFSFEGLDGVELNDDGELMLRTSVGDVKELHPVAFMADDRSAISCGFKLDNGKLTFDLDGYDRSRTLVIDPELIASTYSGAVSYSNYGHCATYGADGSIYTGARAFGPGYPTNTGSFQQNFGGGTVDISVSKLNSDGSSLLWATYLGGSGSEYPHSLIENAQGQLCVLGSSTSANYPVTANGYQTTYGGTTDIVISVVSMDGGSLAGSTYIGGTNSDGANAMYANYGEEYRGEIIVDDQDNILVATFSRSDDFPTTPNVAQGTLGGMQDAVVLKLNSDCSDLLWSTFIGGDQNDGAFGIRTVNGQIYICGQTYSTNMPFTNGAYQTNLQGGQDGYVARLTADGSVITAATYFGTGVADRAYFLDTDTDDNIWIYGQSTGPIPLQPASVYGDPGGTIFLAKLDPALTNVLVSTKIGPGSTPVMTPVAFLVDNCDKIYVSGYNAGWSGLPTTANALSTTGSFYLSAFDVDMSAMVFGTYYGGNHVDGGTSRFDKNGIVYQGVCVTGNGMASVPWAYAETQNISWDIGVFKIDFQVAGVTAAGASPINQGCAPIDIQFSNSSTGTDWLWDFGDGSAPLSAFEPSHTYTQPGLYTVTLIASDSMACNLADTTSFEIEIGAGGPIDAAFTFDFNPDCSSSEVAFTNTSTGGLVTYTWDMGDGTSYTDTNVVHTYAQPGTYTVQLLVSDPSACSQPDSVQQVVQVTILTTSVEAVVDITLPQPCGDMTVTATNSSTGVSPSYQWVMGDGTVLTDGDITYTYSTPGSYTILFIATDPATCNVADTLTWDVQLQGVTAADLGFTTTLSQGCSTGDVECTNTSTGPALQYQWDMGDGTTYGTFDASHTYTAAGMYTITLTAIDPAGCANPVPYYESIYVSEPTSINAGFSLELITSCAGNQLIGTNFSNGDSLGYFWSFGDGSTSTDMNVEHDYLVSGEMIVQLVVVDLNGCVPNDTMQQAIDIPVQTIVNAAFDHTVLDNCDGGQLIAETQYQGPVEYNWDLGDGTTFTGTYVDHQYTVPGSYTITLIASDAGGCGNDTSSVTIDVVLPEPMQLSFDMIETPGCGQLGVECTSTSSGNNINFIWWTSDNFSYYGPEMQHTFTQPGEYEIRFYGLDPMNCFGPDSVVVPVTVDPFIPISADFTLDSQVDCDGTTVQITTANLSPDASFNWTMGDGSSYTDAQFQHLYSAPGEYTIQVTVTDGSGCSDPLTTSQVVTVMEPPILSAGFDLETSGSCGELDIVAMNTSNGTPTEITWDMGNGDVLTGEAIAYSYDSPGTYTITLTVTDPATCNVSATSTESVVIDPVISFDAAFDIQQQAACDQLTVNCTNTSTGTGMDMVWVMGDGSSFTTSNVDHIFTTPGSYQIMLILSDPSGCVPSDTAVANVELPAVEPIDVQMAVAQTGDCSLMQVACTNTTSGDLEWLWDMGDGTQYDTFDANHTYSQPGTYTITLTVSDPLCGQQSLATVPVIVNNGVPTVQLSSPVLCPGSTVTIDASATPGSYTWSNGSTASSITIDQPGVYTVEVAGVDGCTGSAAVSVELGNEFTFTDTVASCPDSPVSLTVPLEGSAYTWSTGQMDRTLTVRGAGIYEFAVTDLDGCQHTGSFTVQALDAEAQLFAPNAFTPDGDGINDIFTIQGFGEEEARLAIYDRWGELLHETKQFPPSWDGFFRGEPVKQDVYVYQLEYRSLCSAAVVNTTGHVTVVR